MNYLLWAPWVRAGVLDSLPASAAAYGLRLLRGKHTGSLVRVRRSSDSSELDIGISSTGAFAQASLATFLGKNYLLNTATLSTQNVTTLAANYTVSFTGTGTLTLSGTSSAGPLVGTGASDRVELTFTPTAGTLTLTVSGSVTLAQLEFGSTATSYEANAGTACSNGFIATWYDQSGNAYDAVQATAANQPQIVPRQYGEKPAIYFDGTNDKIDNTSVAASAPWTYLAVLFPSYGPGSYNMGIVLSEAALEYRLSAAENYMEQLVGGAAIVDNGVGLTLRQISVYQDGTKTYLRRAGGDIGNIAARPPIDVMRLGSRTAAGLLHYQGMIYELAVFGSQLSAQVIATGEANQQNYWGTP